MDIVFRGNVSDEDILSLATLARRQFGEVQVIRGGAGLNPTVVLGIQIASTVIAFLTLCLRAKDLVPKRDFGYEDLVVTLRDLLAEQGAIGIEIIDIANFHKGGDWKEHGPCLLTVRDQNGRCFIVVYEYAHGAHVFEVQRH